MEVERNTIPKNLKIIIEDQRMSQPLVESSMQLKLNI